MSSRIRSARVWILWPSASEAPTDRFIYIVSVSMMHEYSLVYLHNKHHCKEVALMSNQ